MPMPHDIQMQLIKKRLSKLDGKSKILEAEKILEELPKWNTGPYALVRKYVHEQIEKTKTRSKIKHNDFFGVKKQGQKQFVLVGLPSAGKSSLVNALSGMKSKVGSYEFTTLKPQPAIVNIKGAEVQIVDLPGLIKGASDDVGGGKRLLGLVRDCDGIILLHDLTKPFSQTQILLEELDKAKITKELIIVGNKSDLPNTQKNIEELKREFPESDVQIISVYQRKGLDALKEVIWVHSNLIRVYTRKETEPLILEKGATVEDVINSIHKDLIKKFKYARITGKSAKFENQQVSLNHELQDEDSIELGFRN